MSGAAHGNTCRALPQSLAPGEGSVKMSVQQIRIEHSECLGSAPGSRALVLNGVDGVLLLWGLYSRDKTEETIKNFIQ